MLAGTAEGMKQLTREDSDEWREAIKLLKAFHQVKTKPTRKAVKARCTEATYGWGKDLMAIATAVVLDQRWQVPTHSLLTRAAGRQGHVSIHHCIVLT